MKIRINYYDSTGKYKGRIKNIKNLDKLEFNEIENGGQGNFNIELGVKFDCMDFSEGDFIEYIIFDNENKKGLHKFTGIIKGIERFFNISEGEGIKLEIQGLVALLSDFEIKKTYRGTLSQVLNEFINDFHKQKNISHKMQYLGSNIFKNGFKNIESFEDFLGFKFLDFKNKRFNELKSKANKINIEINVQGNFFNALEKIFLGENKEFDGKRNFFINQKGEILWIQEQKQKRIFTLNKNISEININKTGEIIINLINISKNIQVGDLICLQNINKNLNLDGERIKELAFGIDNIVVNAGKIMNYKDLKK